MTMSITITIKGVSVTVGGPFDAGGAPGRVILRITGGDTITPAHARQVARKLLAFAERAKPQKRRSRTIPTDLG